MAKGKGKRKASYTTPAYKSAHLASKFIPEDMVDNNRSSQPGQIEHKGDMHTDNE
jgi:hypothetical protein